MELIIIIAIIFVVLSSIASILFFVLGKPSKEQTPVEKAKTALNTANLNATLNPGFLTLAAQKIAQDNYDKAVTDATTQ